MAEPLNLDAHLLQVLPHIYQSPENQQQEWEAILRQELGRYFDEAEDAVRGYLSARPRILRILTAFERDATAERIVRNYAGREITRVVGLLLDAGGEEAQEQGQQQQQQQQQQLEEPRLTSIATDTPTIEPTTTDGLDRMARRSVTLAPEPATPSGFRQPPSDSMAPPPRHVAPPAPMTPASTPSRARNEHVAQAGPSCLRATGASTPAGTTSTGDRIVVMPSKATGKRSVDSTGTQEQQQTPPSSKRAKKTSLDLPRPVPTWKVTRELGLFEVEGEEYVFQDGRCGPGWYVIRCNIGTTPFVNTPVRFTQHPLENAVALEHFNHKALCHPDDAYNEASIVEKFGYRVYEDVENYVDPTEEAVSLSNERLGLKVLDSNLPNVRKPEDSSKAKGKRKAPRISSRADTQESSDSYRG